MRLKCITDECNEESEARFLEKSVVSRSGSSDGVAKQDSARLGRAAPRSGRSRSSKGSKVGPTGKTSTA